MIDQLERQYGATTVREGGLKVYTTIDPRLQRLAKKAILDVLPYKTDPAAAVVSVEPGHRCDPRDDGGRAHEGQPVQPRGAVDAAGRLDVQDARARVRDRAGRRSGLDVLHVGAVHVLDRRLVQRTKPWDVHTYDNTYNGSESVTRATLQSDNTVYAQLTLDVGPTLRVADGAPARHHDAAGHAGRVDRPRQPRRVTARHGSRLLDVPRDGRLREADGDHEGDPSRRVLPTP